MASKSTDPALIGAEEVDARIAARGLKNLQLYNGAIHHALLAQPNFLRELLAEAFTGHQAQVDTARNGSEGWTLWQGSRYDLIISDQRMPELTGLELLARIRATGSQVPVILASGYGLEGLEPELSEDPRLRILSKPFSFKRIFALAGELIEGR